jgi:hypothetical protein
MEKAIQRIVGFAIWMYSYHFCLALLPVVFLFVRIYPSACIIGNVSRAGSCILTFFGCIPVYCLVSW